MTWDVRNTKFVVGIIIVVLVVVVLKVPLFNLIKRINLDKKPDK